MVYYIFGGMGFFWLVVSALFIHSEPNVHPFITDKELILLSTKIIPKTKVNNKGKNLEPSSKAIGPFFELGVKQILAQKFKIIF